MERMINVNEVQEANDDRALTDTELNSATGGALMMGAVAMTLLLAAPYASTAAAIALLRR